MPPMRGALITVTCDCGERHYVPYGERLECTCGRSWDTNQIPGDEYWGIMHDMRRYRFRAMGMAVAIAAGAIAFARITRGTRDADHAPRHDGLVPLLHAAMAPQGADRGQIAPVMEASP